MLNNTETRILKSRGMSIPTAIILSGLIVGLSAFLTMLIFFGGDTNRQKLSTKAPGNGVSKEKQQQTSNTPTPQQIQMIQQQQQQRAALLRQQSVSTDPKLLPEKSSPNNPK